LVVRNGTARPRPVTTGVGPVTLAAPRVNDRRLVDGVRQKCTSVILPPYVRRSPRVESVLPLLYLHGLSSGDFREALPALLGPEAAGLSSSAILRLTKALPLGDVAQRKTVALALDARGDQADAGPCVQLPVEQPQLRRTGRDLEEAQSGGQEDTVRIGHGQFHHGPATQFGHLRPSAVSSRHVTSYSNSVRVLAGAQNTRGPHRLRSCSTRHFSSVS
jgi:hypothetical protein